MQKIKVSNLKNQCIEFKNLFLPKSESNEKSLNTLLKKIKSTIQCRVLSLTDFLPLKEEKLKIKNYLPQGTSCHTSDLKSDDFEDFKDSEEKSIKRMNFPEIESFLIDSNFFLKSKICSKEKILLVKDVSKNLDHYEFKDFIEGLKKSPEFNFIRFCFFESCFSIILGFKEIETAKYFFNSCEKKLTNFVKAFGNFYQVFFLKRNIEKNNKKDHRELSENNFYKLFLKKKKEEVFHSKDFVGIVLRDLPENYDCKEIEDYLKKEKIDCNLREICKYKIQKFALIKLKKIEDAEKAVFLINGIKIGENEIKANIHSKSNFNRDFLKKNSFGEFFKKPNYEEGINKLYKDLKKLKKSSLITKEKKIKTEELKGEINFGSDSLNDSEKNFENKKIYKEKKNFNLEENSYGYVIKNFGYNNKIGYNRNHENKDYYHNKRYSGYSKNRKKFKDY